jgi:hypothetical protein
VDVDSHRFRAAAWIGLLLMAAITVYALIRQSWINGAIFGCFVLAALVFMRARRRLPALFSLLFVIAALINGAGWAFNLWRAIPYYDSIVHVYTPFAVALAAGFLTYYDLRETFAEHLGLFMIAIASFGLALGAVWEVVEWVMGVIEPAGGVILDLIMDATGAVAAALLSVWAVRRREAVHRRSHSG